MGTNYYVKAKIPCENCGHRHFCREGIHIGKSSAGWKFLFAWNDGEYYKSLPEMKKWLVGKEIVDEYGEPVTHDEFWKMVRSKMNAPNDHAGDSMYCIEIDGIYFMKGWFS